MSEKYVKNKGGRPKVSDARYREHVVSTRLDAVEYLRLEELKLRSGKSAADVIRELITRGYVRERMRRAHLDLMAQLKGIARNLNQLTRLANVVGFGAAIAQKLQPMVAEITEILNRFRDDR
jgi:predicted CopG family antitoxin